MPTILTWLGALLRALSRDERGNTTEHIIWIAGLAAIALAVLAIWGPAIMEAVNKVKFSR